MFKKLIVAFCIFFSFGCADLETSTYGNDEIFNEYEVYSAVIENVYGESKQQIVIFEKTDIDKSNFQKLSFDEKNLKEIQMDFLDFDKSVAESFNSNNEQSYQFERKFNVSMSYVFATEKEFEEIYSVRYPKYYDKFREIFPEAVNSNFPRMILFSKVGFNKNLNQAVVFVQLWTDRKSYFLLKRENCQWKVLKELTMAFH